MLNKHIFSVIIVLLALIFSNSVFAQVEIAPSGHSANAPGLDDIAIGRNADAQGTGGIAIGSFSRAAGPENSVAIGNEATATGQQAIAIGSSNSGDAGEARASGLRATSIGTSSRAGGQDSTALGSGSTANGTNSVAIGRGSNASLSNAQTAAQNNTITVGDTTYGEGVNATGGQADFGRRLITGVADGNVASGSTHAVNGHQLNAVSTEVTENTGDISTNATNIATNTSNITNNRTDIDQNTTDIANRLVRQTGTPGATNTANITVGGNTNGTVIDFANLDGNTRTLTNVTAGTLSSTSTEAVNGAQLFTTNQNVTTNATNIATNTADITTNRNNIATNTSNIANHETRITNNEVAIANRLVRQAGTPSATNTADIFVGGNTNGTVVNFGNLDGNSRTLTNVSAGTLSADSTDAVNGSQLFATNQRVENNTRNIQVNSNNIRVNSKNIRNNYNEIEELKKRTAVVINNHAEQIDLTRNKVVDHSFQLANHERRIGELEGQAKRNSQGVAMALASAPSYSAIDKRGRVNVGVGHFEGETALSASGTYRVKDNRFVYGTVGISGDSAGGAVGMSFGW